LTCITEKLITPESFARVFCDDLDIPASYTTEIAKQITEQIDEQVGVAEVAVRDDVEARDDIEKDLRVVLNVRFMLFSMYQDTHSL
jgi:chromatin structure-remodeling complex subunit SFH1